ncbi:MAG: mRNA cleavage and polyadenylation factor subunit [Phylliscum demangeonii]|nr:MAG: mRNA cleavage and polyadenylation factor subunit [Phylliscum demangeonii]
MSSGKGAVRSAELPPEFLVAELGCYPLQAHETVLVIKTLTLETSEITHEQRSLIAVGTSISTVIDLPAQGAIYIFDVIPVVPDPDRPETNRKLKLIAREEVKGAVTALSEAGTQGFLVAAQAQKCVVRGLKEDGSLLPVAFMDMMCHVSVARCLPGTGMCLFGDAWKGIWFVGYMEEPYKMGLLGKSTGRLEVMAADFLPDTDQLYMVVGDADCNIHIFQYDPEHPKSLSGTHLLPLRTFHTGHFPTTITRIPSSSVSSPPSLPSASSPAPASPPTTTTTTTTTSQQILLTTLTGAIALITRLSESGYRRLSSVQAQLYASLEHPCGLNPKSHRLSAAGRGLSGTLVLDGYLADRGVLDGGLLARWTELDVGRRAEICSRAGTDEDELLLDLRAVGVVGVDHVLAYL